MTIAIAADHAAPPLRPLVVDVMTAARHEPLLLGPGDGNPVDCPVVARVIADALASGPAERGILVCGSGAGVTVTPTNCRASGPPAARTTTPPTRWSSTTTAAS